jgi:hypothetical protein
MEFYFVAMLFHVFPFNFNVHGSRQIQQNIFLLDIFLFHVVSGFFYFNVQGTRQIQKSCNGISRSIWQRGGRSSSCMSPFPMRSALRS